MRTSPKHAITQIAELYAVEKEAKGKSPEERVVLRREKATPIFDELEAWLQVQLRKISGKTKLAEAIRYALTRGSDQSLRRSLQSPPLPREPRQSDTGRCLLRSQRRYSERKEKNQGKNTETATLAQSRARRVRSLSTSQAVLNAASSIGPLHLMTDILSFRTTGKLVRDTKSINPICEKRFSGIPCVSSN
ncbi:Transposase (plasmid) [Phaeobacter inhibens]|uniref:Transposase n=1 Tax=Phaeobacter inhibens TaxID=221822 RepID=A0A2I7KFP0_9RHOB|nr:Transposase [Phaeobacter inhibens]